ncbi:hypothetical protein G647_07542 [Cladophialophora carrionii CBS 160.54]|uniref:Uncharacterized protein n=1 Tax=Cladophialophora carrionii CBS 160.54 TaxID=1279043 RepID=V9D4H8_9EURO|nr:uncharacterized protein G647_07542 [Cladophialophora carrionii CBS 160.54]ETI21198.1 hypothetical protein G647_07542 [Cladophialophora carrionii CBS 160.54]
MSDTIEQHSSLAPSPTRLRPESPCPNFSRPRRGHQRSYSTGLPFAYTKGAMGKSQQAASRQTNGKYHADHALIDPVLGQTRRAFETVDDGTLECSLKRNLANERHCGEQDVRDAFERWILSDKARKRLKQPYFAREDSDPQYSPDSVHLSGVRGGLAHEDGQEEGPLYEKVDGVVMDARPGGSAGPYAMEQTLPEIEAHDIREIQDRSTNRSVGSSAAEDFQAPLSSSSTDSSRERSGASPQLWSESSGSVSTASTDNGVLKPYQHISKEFMPSSMDEREEGRQHNKGSQGTLPPGISELDSGQIPSAELQSTNAVTISPSPLGVIGEEERKNVTNSRVLNTALVPNVKGVRDGEIMGHLPRASATARKISEPSMTSSPQHATSQSHLDSPPRVLGAAGVGGSGQVYELEATAPLKPGNNGIKFSAPPVDHDSTVDEPNAFTKLEHGISRAAHAVHLKVKKNVTFSKVDDVRFRTPSPHPSSLDNTSAVEVDHERRVCVNP